MTAKINFRPSLDQQIWSTIPSVVQLSTRQSIQEKTQSVLRPDTNKRSPGGLNAILATVERPDFRTMSSSRSESQISIFVDFFEESARREELGSQEREWTGWLAGEDITWAHPDPGRAESELGSTVHKMAQSTHPTAKMSSFRAQK